jgi:hypothetical protein
MLSESSIITSLAVPDCSVLVCAAMAHKYNTHIFLWCLSFPPMCVEELVLELLCFDQIATLGLDNLAVSHPSLKNTGRKKRLVTVKPRS